MEIYAKWPIIGKYYNTYFCVQLLIVNREFMAVGEATVVVQGLTPDSNFVGIEQVIRQFPGVTEVSFKKKTTKPYAFVSFEKIEQVFPCTTIGFLLTFNH